MPITIKIASDAEPAKPAVQETISLKMSKTLDGNLLINNDPYHGVKVEDGKLILPNSNGMGVSLEQSNSNFFLSGSFLW